MKYLILIFAIYLISIYKNNIIKTENFKETTSKKDKVEDLSLTITIIKLIDSIMKYFINMSLSYFKVTNHNKKLKTELLENMLDIFNILGYQAKTNLNKKQNKKVKEKLTDNILVDTRENNLDNKNKGIFELSKNNDFNYSENEKSNYNKINEIIKVLKLKTLSNNQKIIKINELLNINRFNNYRNINDSKKLLDIISIINNKEDNLDKLININYIIHHKKYTQTYSKDISGELQNIIHYNNTKTDRKINDKTLLPSNYQDSYFNQILATPSLNDNLKNNKIHETGTINFSSFYNKENTNYESTLPTPDIDGKIRTPWKCLNEIGRPWFYDCKKPLNPKFFRILENED